MAKLKKAAVVSDVPALANVQHALQYVPLGSIDIVRNTRRLYDEAALEELTQSVRAQGVLQSVSLRPHPEQEGRYQLAAGHRRHLAAERAGLQEIPASIRPMTDHEFLAIQLLENLQREDVAPADEAVSFAELLANEFTVEEIALRVGKSPQFVAQRAQLSQLIPEFSEQLRSGRMHLGAASLIARHAVDVQTALVKELNSFHGESITTYHARNWVQKYLRELQRAPFSLQDPTLNPAMGACVQCPLRTSVQTLLFPELADNDCCLNGDCYAVKVATHIERAAAAVVLETQVEPVRIANSHYPADEKLVSRNHYREVDASTPGAVPAVFAEGREGEVVYVSLTKTGKAVAGGVADTVATKEDKKAENAKRIRATRLKRVTNELLAEQLRDRFIVGLEQNGDDARQLLVHFAVRTMTYGVSRTTDATLEYLEHRYGFDKPTGNDLNSQYRSNEPTLHEQYLRQQLARLDVSTLVVLFFDLKFRERIQDEEYSVQTSLAKHLPDGVPNVAAAAEQLLEQRFYTKRPKNTSVEELTQVISGVMNGKEVAGE